MLTRNLQSTATRSAIRKRALSSRPNANFPPPFRICSVRRADFHSSSARRNEVPKSPFQTFVDVLKDELRKNRELQDNVKQLQGDVDKFQDSETMKRARAAYERARVCSIPCLCHYVGNSIHASNFAFSLRRASKKTLVYVLQLRSCARPASK